MEEEISINYNVKYTYFFGLKVSLFTSHQLIDYITQTLCSNKPKVFFGYSMGLIAKLKMHPEIYYYSNDFDLMVTDGRLFYLLAKFIGLPLKYDISIPYLTELVLEIGDKKRASLMVLGSTKERNLNATLNIKNKYKNLIVFDGYTGGNFTENEFQETIEQINKYSPDILLIGVSSSKKEYFAYKCKDDLKVKIIIPCGGMVDILANQTKRIPLTVKKIGLGWIWRLIQEPKRLFHLQMVLMKELIFRIVPIVLLNRNKKNFFLPAIYGIAPIIKQKNN